MNIININNNSTNCYLVPAKEGWLLVDTGLPDTFSHLLQLLDQKKISVNEINYLLITHYHPDHAGLTQYLRNLGTVLLVHEEQLLYIQKLNSYYKKNSKSDFRDIIMSDMVILSDSGSRTYLESIGIKGSLIATPGHSDDSISLVLDEKGFAFTGDLPDDNAADALYDPVISNSWDTLREYQVQTICPGHGEPYQISDPN